MTQEGGNGGREQSWRDTLPESELQVAERIRSMPPSMQASWVAVEISRVRTVVTAIQAKLFVMESSISTAATNAANAASAAASVAAANAAASVAAAKQNGNWTITATQRAVAIGMGGAMAAGAYAVLKALGVL